MALTLRTATMADAQLIAEISQKTFYDTFAPDNRPEDMDKFLTQQFTKGRLMLEVGAAGLHFLLAYLDEAMAGYVKLREGPGPRSLGSRAALEIARLYALSHMIGKGVGAALMQASLDRARALGKDTVWLAVWDKNERALNFYRRWGFEIFDETGFLLGNDLQHDWLMRRKV